MLGGFVFEKQIHRPPKRVPTPSEVVVPSLSDSVRDFSQIGIVGNTVTVQLCRVPLVAFVSVPVIVIRNDGVQQRKPKSGSDRDVPNMRAEHRLGQLRSLEVIRRRRVPPERLTSDNQPARLRPYAEGPERSLETAPNPRCSEIRRHVE